MRILNKKIFFVLFLTSLQINIMGVNALSPEREAHIRREIGDSPSDGSVLSLSVAQPSKKATELTLKYMQPKKYDKIMRTILNNVNDAHDEFINEAICRQVNIPYHNHNAKLINELRNVAKLLPDFLQDPDPARNKMYALIEKKHFKRDELVRAEMVNLQKEGVYNTRTKIEEIPLHGVGIIKQDSTQKKSLKLCARMALGAAAGTLAGFAAASIYANKFGANSTVTKNTMLWAALSGLLSGHSQTTGAHVVGTVACGAAATTFAKDPAKAVVTSGQIGAGTVSNLTTGRSIPLYVAGGVAGIVFNKEKSFEVFSNWGGYTVFFAPIIAMMAPAIFSSDEKSTSFDLMKTLNNAFNYYPLNTWPFNRIHSIIPCPLEMCLEERFEHCKRLKKRGKQGIRERLDLYEIGKIASKIARLNIPDDRGIDLITVSKRDNAIANIIRDSDSGLSISVSCVVRDGKWHKKIQIQCGQFRDKFCVSVIPNARSTYAMRETIVAMPVSEQFKKGLRHFLELFWTNAPFSKREIESRARTFTQAIPLLSNNDDASDCDEEQSDEDN